MISLPGVVAPVAAHVEMDSVGQELLAAHRVPRAGDAHAAALVGRGTDGRTDIVDRLRPDDPRHPGRIERRVRVVEDDRLDQF